MPEARVPLAGSPPGRSSQRADLSPAAKLQPMRIPTGQAYGSAKQVEQMQASRPLRNAAAQPAPGGGGSSPSPATAMRGPFGGGGLDPAQVLATVSANPSARPGEPITAGVQPPTPLGAGFKLDVLRHIAALPFAGPEIQQLVQKAYLEANVGNRARIY